MRNPPLAERDDRDPVVGRRVSCLPEGELTHTRLAGLVEPEVVPAHDRPRRHRREVRAELFMAEEELDVGRLHVHRILGEAGQSGVGVALLPGVGHGLHQPPESVVVEPLVNHFAIPA